MYNGYCNEDKKIERVGALTIKVMNISMRPLKLWIFQTHFVEKILLQETG